MSYSLIRSFLKGAFAVAAAVALICAVAWAQGVAQGLHEEQQGPEDPAHAVGQCSDCHAAGDRLPTKGAVMEAILNLAGAFVAQDKEAITERMVMPGALVFVSPDTGANVIPVTQEALDQLQPGQGASEAKASKMRVDVLAYNVAVASFSLSPEDEAATGPQGDWVALLTRQAGTWKVAAAAGGDVDAAEPDAETGAALKALIGEQIQAFVGGEREKYLALYADQVVSVDPDWGARVVGRQELLSAYQMLAELIAQGGITKVEADDLRVVTFGPDVVLVQFTAKALDDAGLQIGHRDQAYVLVKQADGWRIVAEAVGMAEEG